MNSAFDAPDLPDDYIVNILDPVPTSIHIPPPLLEAVDREAAAQGISRNRFIVQTLEQALEQQLRWSPELWATLEDPSPAGAVDELLGIIRKHRTTKGPVSL